MCTIGKNVSQNHSLKNFLKDGSLIPYNSLLGVAMLNKELVVLKGHNIIMRRDHKMMRGKVKIIGGGGAGTEPAEAGYVGQGMLTAAVIGEIFTSPSANEILIAIRELAGENNNEILLLVKNYLGDKLNFGLALDKAVSEGINVKMLVIGDNVTEVKSETNKKKGLAGSVLVYKIAGYLAEEGKTLEEIIEDCREEVLTDLLTASATINPCGNIICDPVTRHLGSDEMFLGMGIYGQFGTKKVKIDTLSHTVEILLREILNSMKEDNTLIKSNVVVMINNLGGMSKLEETIITTEVSKQVTDLGINISSLYAGMFMTSLNTQGFSITVLKINSPKTLKCLNAPTTASAWSRGISEGINSLPIVNNPTLDHNLLNSQKLEGITGPLISDKAVAALKQILVFAAEALISCEKQLNIIDSEVGDGDAGTVLKRGAEALRLAVFEESLDFENPCRLLYQISDICCNSIGGLTGALYTVFFRAAAKVFQNAEEITLELCCSAFKSAVKAVKCYGKAEIGDRTMIDALSPASETFESAINNRRDLTQTLYVVAATCEYKAEQTKFIKPLWMKTLNCNKALMYADAGAHAAAFEEDECYKKDGIFLWRFLDEEEAIYVLKKDVCPPEITALLEKKVGTDDNLFVLLLLECIDYCRKAFKKNERKTSAFIGIVYFTHKFFVSSRWRTPAQVFEYFKESIMRHSLVATPDTIEIFLEDEIKEAIKFFFEIYIRNLPLIQILHVKHYQLILRLPKKPKSIADKRPSEKDGNNKHPN